MENALWVLVGYLFGSFPSGFLLVRLLKGIDIRTVGSGNIGATNVGRCVGRFWAVVVSVADMLKGGLAVLLARALATPGADISWLLAGVGVASVLGHNFPVWLGFRGGKGVSTTYGMLFFLAPPVSCYAVLAGGAVWFLLLGIWRYVSLASMLSLWVVALLFAALHAGPAPVAATVFLALMVLVRHRENVKRLLAGKEPRVGRPKTTMD